MKKERCVYEFKQGNAEVNLTIDFISKKFAIRPCMEINASFDGDGDIDYINNLVDDYVGMLADIKQFALAELFGYGAFETKDASIDGGGIEFNAKELISVDSLVEVPFELDSDGDIHFAVKSYQTLYAYCREKYIEQAKIKRILLEMKSDDEL